ncbi:MAG: hypothetical protein WBB28_04455 [Crinalium sp.]
MTNYSKALAPSKSTKQLLSKLKITKADLVYGTMLSVILAYLIVREPLFVCVLGCASLVAMGAVGIVRAIPVLEKQLKTKIKFWHISSLILAATAVFGTFGAPAQAVFLTGLEAYMKELVANSGQGIEEDTIGLIFSSFRGVFLLLAGGAGLYAYNQGQQQNDWRPIVTQIGLAFGIVFALDIITFLFIGSGTGTGG